MVVMNRSRFVRGKPEHDDGILPLDRTPQVVGPGRYNATQKKASRVSYAPFSQSTSKLEAGDSANPGPGDYWVPSNHIVKDTNTALTSFACKVARFAAQDKAEYTITPGPGSYSHKSQTTSFKVGPT